MEICSGVALFAGPGIGSIFFVIGEKTTLGGYSTPFYLLSTIFISIIPMLLFVLDTDV
jgi:hypothetical protein